MSAWSTGDILFFVFLVMLGALGTLFWRWAKPRVKGAAGEAGVGLLLKGLPEEQYRVLHNILLRTDRGTSQIDFVVVSVYGLFVIEVKNYKGWIFGDENSRQWTQTVHGTKNRFLNPIWQNEGHVKALRALLADPDLPIFPIVTFPGDCTLKVKSPNHPVVRWGALRKSIRKCSGEPVLTKERMEQLGSKIEAANIDSSETRKEHVEEIRAKVQAPKEGRCPRCGGVIVERKGKYGTFLGCSNYPKCRYTVKTGVK